MADIVFTTASLPDAYAGVPYEAAVGFKSFATALSAGSVTSGALPTGLSLDATDHVRITGTPKAAGPLPHTYTFKLTLTDTAGAVQSGNLTITVREVPSGIPETSLPVVAQMAHMWPNQF